MAKTATAKAWTDRVARWERSGQTAKAFAAKEGVSAQSLAWWKWRLRREAAEAKGKLAFVQVRAGRAEPFEVVLAGGRSVRVAAGFDANELVRLVAALEERAS